MPIGTKAVARQGLGIATAAAIVVLALPLHAQQSVSDFRGKMEKWVETRRILSEEEADWEVEQETLRATRDLLRQQKEALEAEIADLTESNSGADEERTELLLRRGDYQRSAQAMEVRIRASEVEALALGPLLPLPLQKKLELLLVQIPEDPEKTKSGLGQRLMSVLGVLAQAEKFNSTATFEGETRAVGGDQKVQVRTLYWGLGQAVYVDAQGETAGFGRPGREGWVFADEPGIEDDAKLILDIYEGNVDVIEFVDLPVEIRP